MGTEVHLLISARAVAPALNMFDRKADSMSRLKSLLFPLPPSGRLGAGLLLLRAVAGAAFMFHGWTKIQNPFAWMGDDSSMPSLLQALAALSEFGGGLAWILGLVTPLASAGILCTMSVAVWTHAVVRGDPFVGRGTSFELGLVYAAIAVTLMVFGPGSISLDAMISKQLRRETARE